MTLTSAATPRQVKEAVVLANIMRTGPFRNGEFQERLIEVRSEIQVMSDPEIDRHFDKHADRLRRINEGKWTLETVALEHCLIWPEFGGRKWFKAAAPVNVTADALRFQRDSQDRIWEMVKNVEFFVMPLVMTRINKSPTKFYIDDGAHRAVATYLGGIERIHAFIGNVDERINHGWKWIW